VDAARRGAAAAARSLSRRRRDEANALPAQRSPATLGSGSAFLFLEHADSSSPYS